MSHSTDDFTQPDAGLSGTAAAREYSRQQRSQGIQPSTAQPNIPNNSNLKMPSRHGLLYAPYRVSKESHTTEKSLLYSGLLYAPYRVSKESHTTEKSLLYSGLLYAHYRVSKESHTTEKSLLYSGLLYAPYRVSKESHTTEKSLLYSGRVYASDRTIALAFLQEYAEISGRKSDKDSMKAVMDLGCLTRSTHTTLRQQIKEVIIPGEP